MQIQNPFRSEGRLGQYWHTRWARWSAAKHNRAVHKCILQLLEQGDSPAATGIALQLYELWGDPLDPARESYLRSCLAEFSEARGAVLLSSASLMTLILGAIAAGDKRRTIWCLEQNTHWINVLRTWIKRYDIKGTHIINTHPFVKGGMVRYRIDAKHLPRNIGLVLCDSPAPSPGATLSTLVTVGNNLAPAFTVFSRRLKSDDGPLIKRWASKHDATFVLINKRDGFAKIARRESQQGIAEGSGSSVIGPRRMQAS